MYDLNKRKQISCVGELKEVINDLSNTTKVNVTGDDYVWVHLEQDGTLISLDTEDLEEHYEEQTNDINAGINPIDFVPCRSITLFYNDTTFIGSDHENIPNVTVLETTCPDNKVIELAKAIVERDGHVTDETLEDSIRSEGYFICYPNNLLEIDSSTGEKVQY